MTLVKQQMSDVREIKERLAKTRADDLALFNNSKTAKSKESKPQEQTKATSLPRLTRKRRRL